MNNKGVKLLAAAMVLAVAIAGAFIFIGNESDADGTTSVVTVDANATEADAIKTIADALKVSGVSKIVLGSNITEDVVITTGIIEIDLNGFTITNASNHTISVSDGASLTISDSSAEKNGKVDNITHAKGALYNAGTVILNGGKFLRSAETGTSGTIGGGNSWYTIQNNGTMTINAGVIVENGNGTTTGKFSSIMRNGDSEASASGTMTINGGTFTGGLYVKNELGKLEIKGGTFQNGSSAAVFNYSELLISGGSFSCNTTDKSAVFIYYNDTVSSTNEVTITGGTFTSDDGARGTIYLAGAEAGTIAFNMSGATISGPIVVAEDIAVNGTITLGSGVGVGSIKLEGVKAGTNGIKISTGSVNISGNFVKDQTGNITITGKASLIGDVTIGSGATLTINAGATLTIPEGKKIENAGTVTNNGTVVNNGTLKNTNIFTNGTTGTLELYNEVEGEIVNDGTVAIAPGVQQPTLASASKNKDVVSTNSQGDALGLNKNLDSDYEIKTKAFLEKDLIVMEDVTLTVGSNAVLDLNGKNLKILGTLVVKNNGVITTISGATGAIQIGKTGVIDNKGVIGKDNAVSFSLYQPTGDTSTYQGQVSVKDAVGIGFGIDKVVSGDNIKYTLTITGNVSKKGAATGTVTVTDGIVYAVGELSIGNGVTLAINDGKELDLKKNSVLDITTNGFLTTAGTGSVKILPGAVANLNGRTSATFVAETGSFITSDTFTAAEKKLATTSFRVANIGGITLEVVSTSEYCDEEGVEAEVTTQKLVLSGDFKDKRTKDEVEAEVPIELEVDTDHDMTYSAKIVKNWMKYAGFFVEDTVTLCKELNLSLGNSVYATIDGTVQFPEELSGIVDSMDASSQIYGAVYSVEAKDANGAKTTTYFIKSFENALADIDNVVDKTISVYGNVTIDSEVTIAADQVVDGKAIFDITKDGKLTVENDASLNVKSMDVEGILLVKVDGAFAFADDGIFQYSAKKTDSESGDVTYLGFIIALGDASEGDVLELKGTITDLTESFTIPAGVTVKVIDGATLKTTKDLTVNGTLINKGGNVEVGKKTNVNGTIDITEGTKTELKGDVSVSGEIVSSKVIDSSIATKGVNGAYYKNDDGMYVYTTPAKAVDGASKKDTVREVFLVGVVSDSTPVNMDNVKMYVDGANVIVTLGEVTVVNKSIIDVKNGATFSGTIIGKDGAEETTGAVVDTIFSVNKGQSFKVESKSTVNAMNAKVWSTVLTTTDADEDLVGEISVSAGVLTIGEMNLTSDNNTVVGSIIVGKDAGLIVPKDVALTVGKNVVKNVGLLTVDGNMSIIGTLNVNGLVNVNGNMNVVIDKNNTSATVTVTNSAAGTYSVLNIAGTITVDDNEFGTGTVDVKANGVIAVADGAYVIGPVNLDGTGHARVYDGADLSKAEIEWNAVEKKTEAKTTVFNINNEPYMTVYAVGANYSVVLAAAQIELEGYVTSITENNVTKTISDVGYWYTDIELKDKAVDGAIGKDAALYCKATPSKVLVNVSVGTGISLYIDGIKTYSTNSAYLAVGTHTVSAVVDPGYKGDFTIQFNGVTVSNGSFVITPEMAGNSYDQDIIVSVSGNITEDSTVIVDGGSNGGSDGMSITDILLIVLVVLIVIMAILVAIRMMRS